MTATALLAGLERRGIRVRLDLGGISADGERLRTHVGIVVGRLYVGVYLRRSSIWAWDRVRGRKVGRCAVVNVGPFFLVVTW